MVSTCGRRNPGANLSTATLWPEEDSDPFIVRTDIVFNKNVYNIVRARDDLTLFCDIYNVILTGQSISENIFIT